MNKCRPLLLLAILPLSAGAALAAAPAAPAPAPARASTPAQTKPAAAPPAAKPKPPVPVDYRFEATVTVDAVQNWTKNDPKHPGEQFSKATTQQRWEVVTTLHSDGVLEVRDLLDADLDTRLEAKVIHLARRAKQAIEARGGKLVLPTTPEEKLAMDRRFQVDIQKCNGVASCTGALNLEYAAVYAALEYPEALEEDENIPGQYLYLEPFKGCPSHSHIQLTMAIDGKRWNKDVDKFVDFSERRSADTVDTVSEGLSLCSHYLIVIDTQDPKRGMRVENVFFPSTVGVTEYTERGRTQKTTESQPMPGAVMEWVDATLRQAPLSGKASADLPLSISLNGVSIWLGLWSGTAKTTLEWRLVPVPAAAKKP